MSEEQQNEETGREFVAGPPTITIAGITATLKKPSTLQGVGIYLSADQIEKGGAPLHLCRGAAALYLSWPETTTWPAGRRPRPWKPSQSMNDFGQEIFDRADEALGDNLGEFIDACGMAYQWVTLGGITEEKVKAAEDFSAPPAGG